LAKISEAYPSGRINQYHYEIIERQMRPLTQSDSKARENSRALVFSGLPASKIISGGRFV